LGTISPYFLDAFVFVIAAFEKGGAEVLQLVHLSLSSALLISV